MENPVSKHRKSKLNYLSKKIQLQKINSDLLEKNKELAVLQSAENKTNEIAECTNNIKQLEVDQTRLQNEVLIAEKEVSNSKNTALNSNISGYDNDEKLAIDFFDINNKRTTSYKEPHSMSNKEIVDEFKSLKFDSINWINSCPQWQQDRLMSLYDNFSEDPNAQFDDNKPNSYDAIISKNDVGFYDFKNGTLKKKFTVNLGNTVILEPNSTSGNKRVIEYKKEHYVCVKYKKGGNLKTGLENEFEGYVKTKNVTIKSSTADIASTIQASQDDLQGLSSASKKLFSKRKLFLTANKDVPDNFHVNSSKSFLNPALMSDKEIFEHFKVLIDKDKHAPIEWIDAFFIHNSRLRSIYNKVLNKTDADLSEDKPKNLMGIIKDVANANVYKLNNNNVLERFANLKKGDYVRVNIDPNSSTDVSFNFFKSFNKQYVPIFVLFNNTIVPGYVNSSYVSFVTTDENSVLSQCSYKNTVSSTNDDSKYIENFTKTLGANVNNPLAMSDKEISEYINTLNNFDEVYKWANSFPLQSRRIKTIYANMSISDYKFDEEKPSKMLATVIRDSTHIYPVNSSGTGIKENQTKNTTKSQSITSVGTLEKGGKVRLALDSNNSSGNPSFTYHKNLAGKPTKYVKIHYLNPDLEYVEGFISVNAISIYTIDEEVSEIIDSLIYSSSDNCLDDDFDLSLSSESASSFSESSLESISNVLGESGFDFKDKEDADGNVIKDSSGEAEKNEVDSLNKSSFDISITGFAAFSSLLAAANALKNYGSIVEIGNILNEELATIFSSTSSLIGNTLSLTTASIPSSNSHVENFKTATIASNSISAGIENIKFLYTEIPAILNSIKHREGLNAEESLEKALQCLSLANTTIGLFADLSPAIPIVSAAINVLKSIISCVYNLIKFISMEIQIWEMFRKKNILKDEALTKRQLLNPKAQHEQKLQREQRLEIINKEIKKLDFKDQRRDNNENLKLQELKNERLEYMDLFITTELENINKKRRNRQLMTLTEDILNLIGNIATVIATAVPEPNTILAASMVKLGTKAGASAIDIGFAAARNIKQWYRDKKQDDPNNTRNKQIKNARIAAGMINNIVNLPKPPAPPKNNKRTVEYLKQKAFAEKRYLLVQSHIISSGTSLSELEHCNGDPKEIFRLLYSALLKRK